MIAFRVTVNGQHLATAGLSGEHVLNAIVNSAGGKTAAGEAFHDLWMHLGGLDCGSDSGERQRVDWLQDGRLALNVGDKVTIELVEVEAVDLPLLRAR